MRGPVTDIMKTDSIEPPAVFAQSDLFDLPSMPGDPRDYWSTPADTYALIEAELGPFQVDLAANEYNAKCKRWIGEDEDSLSVAWHKLPQPCFLNPPYSNIRPWVEHAYHEMCLGGEFAVLLPGHRREQGWYHDWIVGKARFVYDIRGRTAYGQPPGVIIKGGVSSPKFPSMVVSFAGRPTFTMAMGLG